MENVEENKITNTLSDYKNIKPDAGFVEKSKSMVFSTSQIKATPMFELRRALWENFKFIGVLTASGFLALIITLGAINAGTSNKNSLAQESNATSKNLFLESQAIDFQIRLDEARYFNESAQKVAAVLNKIDGSGDASIPSVKDETKKAVLTPKPNQ